MRRAHLDAACGLVEKHPDPVQEAYLHITCGWLAVNLGDHVGAAAAFVKAHEAAEQAHDPEITAAVDGCQVMGGYDAALLPELEAALATARAHHNQPLERMILINLSELSLAASDPDVVARGIAWGRYRVSMLGDLDSAAMGLDNAGAAGVLTGLEIDRAIGELIRAVELAHRVSDVFITVECLLRLSAAEVLRGDTVRAGRLYGYWYALNAEYGLGMQESNQRFRDICLAELDEADGALPDGQVSLKAAAVFAMSGSAQQSAL